MVDRSRSEESALSNCPSDVSNKHPARVIVQLNISTRRARRRRKRRRRRRRTIKRDKKTKGRGRGRINVVPKKTTNNRCRQKAQTSERRSFTTPMFCDGL